MGKIIRILCNIIFVILIIVLACYFILRNMGIVEMKDRFNTKVRQDAINRVAELPENIKQGTNSLIKCNIKDKVILQKNRLILKFDVIYFFDSIQLTKHVKSKKLFRC